MTYPVLVVSKSGFTSSLDSQAFSKLPKTVVFDIHGFHCGTHKKEIGGQ